MNTSDIYQRIRNPPPENIQKEQEHLESLKIIARQEEEMNRLEWLEDSFTQKVMNILKNIMEKLDNDVRFLSSNPKLFSEVGQLKAHEAKILRKVINYGSTGKYETE